MPFSTLSEFEHAREAEQRERNPRHVARKGGDKKKSTLSDCVEEGLAHRKSRHNVEGSERKANAE